MLVERSSTFYQLLNNFDLTFDIVNLKVNNMFRCLFETTFFLFHIIFLDVRVRHLEEQKYDLVY